jgi:hypothetical protein
MNGMSMDVRPFSADPLGWIIAIAGAVVTLWTILFAVRAMVSPGETDPSHPKQLILKDDR